MADKHTPGPWFADDKGNIWRRDPADLYENGGTVAGDMALAVASKGWYGEGSVGYPVEANARLISAAPELLEAGAEFSALYGRLWDMVDGCGYLSPDSIKAYDAAHEKLRAAISKARGASLDTDDVVECSACFGKGFNDVQCQVAERASDMQDFRETCEACDGTGKIKARGEQV